MREAATPDAVVSKALLVMVVGVGGGGWEAGQVVVGWVRVLGLGPLGCLSMQHMCRQ